MNDKISTKQFLDEIGTYYEDYCIEGTAFNKESASEVRDFVFAFYKQHRKREANLVEACYK